MVLCCECADGWCVSLLHALGWLMGDAFLCFLHCAGCGPQIDLLEADAVADVVVLSVVLEEVKHKNLSAYNRLRALCANKERRFFVFANEHHRYRKTAPNHREKKSHSRPLLQRL